MVVVIGVLRQCVEHPLALVFEIMVSQCRSLGLVQVIDLARLDDEALAGIFCADTECRQLSLKLCDDAKRY